MLTALDAGADDIADDGDSWRVTTPPSDLHPVQTALEGAGITVDSADVTMVPSTQVALDTAEAAKQVLRLIDALDDHDDVQEVYANFDVSDEVMAAVEV
jgi:transcriptional/translational regulatory protein YebC/TACO1